MNDHISTYLRIKPVKNCSDCFEIDQVENHRLNVNLESDKCNEYIDNTKLNHTFCFNGIIDSNSKQEEVFELIGIQSLTHTFDGFNSTVRVDV